MEGSPEHLWTRPGPRNLDLMLEETSETSSCTLERALVALWTGSAGSMRCKPGCVHRETVAVAQVRVSVGQAKVGLSEGWKEVDHKSPQRSRSTGLGLTVCGMAGSGWRRRLIMYCVYCYALYPP